MENTEQNQAVTPISQDLLDKVQAAKALVTAHSLLGVGMFQHRHQDALKQSIDFLTALHKQVLDEALQHPDADKVPDLAAYREEQELKAKQMAEIAQRQAELEQLIKDAKEKAQE